MYAARNNFAFDVIHWEKIDGQFFGAHECDVGDVWRKRFCL